MIRVRADAVATVVLCLLVGAMTASVLVPSRPVGLEREGEERDATFGADAVRFRMLRLRDRSGRVPANAYMRAKRQVDALRWRGAVRRIEFAPSAAPSPDMFATTTTAAAPAASSGVASPISPHAWRWLGPGNIGGRIRTLAVQPTNSSVMFAGSAGGGIWKTTNGGARWVPVDDFMAVLSVSSIVINPANPSVMYAATGEGFGNGDAIAGAGIFKSTDGGATWSQLPSTASEHAMGTVNRVAISPDGRVLLAATASGSYRSTDGGVSFAFLPSGIAAQDVKFHPTDGTRAIAGGWGRVAYSWDGGATWQRASGLPACCPRIELAYARSQPDVVYASIDSHGGMLYRSANAGATFAPVSPTGLLGVQGWYDNALWVSPTDSNHVIVGGVRLQQSRDGGSTWQGFSASIHPDHHAIVADPKYDGAANRRVFFANDGGVFSVDDIETVEMTGFRSLNNNLGVTQFYGGAGHAATGTIVGGAQDNGMLVWTPLSGTSWTQRIAGDGGYAASDPADSQYFYGEGIYLRIFRSVNGGRGFTYVGGGITDAGANANFIAPFVLDPGNPQRMFAGGASLWRGDNVKSVAPVWKAIKPSAQRDYISAIAVAPGNSDLVWVGHDLGRVFKSANATSSSPAWTAVAVPTSAMITHVAISAFDSNTVYVTTGSFGPTNILKTTDGGATWIDATGAGTTGLPDAPVNDLEIDPVYPDTIYAATEVGVFASVDGGVHWDLPQDGPANVCVDDLFWMGSRLVAVTHGRGMFSIDVSGDGAPLLTKSIGSIVFGKQAVGATSAAQTVTISNVGPGPLTIASVRLAGAQPGDFAIGTTSCAGASLAPGAGCFIRLTFRPTTGGARSATLTIASNAASSPDTVALSGAGVAPAGALPSGWTSQDVGSVGIVGAASYSNGTFTVRGAGADIWGTTDAFRFVYQTLSGDGAIVARVAGVDNVYAWTKAGVMMRATTAAGSANVALFVTPAKGVAFQRRTTTGGATTSTAAAGAAPRWLKLSRAGSIVKASTSVDGAAWTLVGRQSMAWGGSLLVGVAVTSHAVGQAASAMFDNVSVVTSPAPSALPARWQTRDVGLVGAAGSTSESGASLTLKGAGDIWGTADAFRYAYAPLAGDGTVVARVVDVQDVNAWTKAGVMIRQTLGAGSAHAALLVTPGKGLAFQRRGSTGGASRSTAVAGVAPYWVRLVRSGQVVRASISIDGSSWTSVGQDTIALSGGVWVGMVVSSHDVAQLARATFDHVAISESAAPR